ISEDPDRLCDQRQLLIFGWQILGPIAHACRLGGGPEGVDLPLVLFLNQVDFDRNRPAVRGGEGADEFASAAAYRAVSPAGLAHLVHATGGKIGARFGLSSEFIERLRAANILYDRDERG